jgi:CTP-dependent riboflavin kinase
MRLFDYVPELKTVSGRDAGILILLSLVVQARRGDDPYSALDVTISALANQYSVSRGHVMSVLRDAEEQGMIARVGERGEGIAVTEALLDGLDTLAAVLLLAHLAAVRQALAEMGEADSGPVSEGAASENAPA